MSSIDDLSDADLIAAVASVVRTPRADPADSFVLHAPLELAARAALLPRVAPGERTQGACADRRDRARPTRPSARRRLPRATSRSTPLAEAASRLTDSIAAGDLDEVDAVAVWLGRHVRSDELAPLLADAIVPSLAAAAHGSIFLFQMPRVAPRGELTGELLRPLAREVARNSDWQLRWFMERDPVGPASADALFSALQATPRLGVPGSDFIYPLMSQVERQGVAAALLGDVTSLDVEAAARVILRAAALSMLQEPGDHAPYGWSHCLTMPQAVLGVARSCADASVAIAVAATYVVGFRAALAVRPLDARWVPDDPGISAGHCTRDLSRPGGGLGVARSRRTAPSDRHAPGHSCVGASRRPSREVHARLPRRGELASSGRAALPLRCGLSPRSVDRARLHVCCRRICVNEASTSSRRAVVSTSSRRLMCRHDFPFECLPSRRSNVARCSKPSIK